MTKITIFFRKLGDVMRIKFDDIFNEENLQLAMEDILSKRDSCGSDGIWISQFQEYWKFNQENIINKLKDGIYEPKVVQEVEIVGYNGKRRVISKLSTIDRFILRAIMQKLRPICEEVMSEYCYSYREGCGVLTAVQQASEYVGNGYEWAAEIDIKKYFDNINLNIMQKRLEETLGGTGVVYKLIEKYFCCKVEYCGTVRNKSKGLIQGSSLSPLLSNLYMSALDGYLEEKEFKFIRYGDDINIYTRDAEEAERAYILVKEFIAAMDLQINEKKSGVYHAFKRTYLGYEFIKDKNSGNIFVQRVQKQREHYGKWNKSVIQKIDRNYHIINDGILTKKDYTILFENDNGKKYVPVETADTINLYSDIIFTSNFFQFISNRNLRVTMFDKYGNYIGNFVGKEQGISGKTMIKQAAIYIDEKQRLEVAKSIIMAATHNIRSNLRYYYKKTKTSQLQERIQELSKLVTQMNEANNINQLLMIEARSRQNYYQAFNYIILNDEFHFKQRTKRPPKDPLNAMISFGNVYLYNRLSTEIRKTSMDIKIGFLHSTNRRAESLNLDIAEIFKPIIVDRVIFTMINRNAISERDYFEQVENGGIYLSKNGKKLFIENLEKKVYSKINYKDEYISYDTLMRKEVRKVLRLVLYGEKYKPYKYTN